MDDPEWMEHPLLSETGRPSLATRPWLHAPFAPHRTPTSLPRRPSSRRRSPVQSKAQQRLSTAFEFFGPTESNGRQHHTKKKMLHFCLLHRLLSLCPP